LAAAEAFLPLLIEDIGDVDARGTFDLGVAVDEGHAQHAAEVLANGSFAGAHGADQVEVSLAEHRSAIMPQNACGGAAGGSRFGPLVRGSKKTAAKHGVTPANSRFRRPRKLTK